MSNIVLAAGSDDDYQISRSVRLRSSASAYLNRTPASAGNRKTWTWSGWVKRGTINSSGYYSLFSAGTTSPTYDGFRFSLDSLQFFQAGGNSSNLVTTSVYRDASAWYHIVIVVDTTQATSSNRVKIYVNGVQITSFSTSNYPPLNSEASINNTLAHNVGAQQETSASFHLDGYLTEVHFVDGQALTPSSFGETDSITGVWKPKRYTGTYGTNGFYLNFSDNSAATAAAIGKDYSGNGNNWTPNNISVTAGVTYDSMLDVPMLWDDGGNGRGNYAVINPISTPAAGGVPAIADGNLRMVGGTANSGGAWSTIALPTSGQFYAESTVEFTTGSYQVVFGIADNSSTSTVIDVFVGDTSANQVRVNGSNVQAFTPASGDVFSFAVDCGTGVVVVRRNNTTIYTSTSLAVADKNFFFYRSSNGGQRVNFGQRPFAYTPPTGFKALNTQNLPEPTIKKGNQYFDVSLYSGNNSTQTVVNSGAMQPDLVWIKSRNITGANHVLTDSVRGATKFLISNLTDSEFTIANTLTSFNSNGFSLGNTAYDFNISGNNYAAWQWKESPSAGFDIVTYTGTGSATTVAHSLGVAPKLMFIKARSLAGSGWTTYSSVLGAGQFLSLNATSAATSSIFPFNNTAPTSSVFSVGPTGNGTNNSGVTYVAYLFADVAGFSRFGSYTGNGSADGPFVFCGFRPRFVMIKASTTAGGGWVMHDTSRSPGNLTDQRLAANTSGAEFGSDGFGIDVTSNGFKIRTSDGNWNASSIGYIFAAFAESPFKNSLAR